MRAMTEIEWLDGRVTKVPELALGDALGESVQAELDFGFDDVLEGLWVEVRHLMSRMRTRTATRAGGAAHCTRTAGTAWSNRRTSTVSSASFTRGSRGSSRVAGELVNLSRACAPPISRGRPVRPSGYRVPTFIRTCADECGRCSDEVDNQGFDSKRNLVFEIWTNSSSGG